MESTFKSTKTLPQPGQQRDRKAKESSRTVPTEAGAPAASGSGEGSKDASSAATPQIATLDVSKILTGKGGGALRSIDQQFAVNPSNGTFSLNVPLNFTNGRNNFHPSLSLSYDSGSGNGPFGIGWQLAVQSITRQTSHRIPNYGPDDNSFVLSGADDLIPILDEVVKPRDGYTIRVYRPRVELDQIMRVEQWASTTDSDCVFWKTISGENFTNIYGRTDSSRVFDGAGNGHSQKRIFSWLLCESYDPFGNAISYTYKAENDDGLNAAGGQQLVFESNRNTQLRHRARYLKSIKYGNCSPCRDVKTWIIDHSSIQAAKWCYEVVFDYGEHSDACPETVETRPWDLRRDPFSLSTSGFEVRAYRLCRRVLMFHHFPNELGRADYLVSSTTFTYNELPTGAFMQSVVKSGHIFDEATKTYDSESLAPLDFEYSRLPDLQSLEIQNTKPTCLQTLPVSLPKTVTRWIDLDGDGLPGLLVQMDGAWYYQRNDNPMDSNPSDGESESESETEVDITNGFGPVRQLPKVPNVQDFPKHSFEDLDGSGKQSLVVQDDGGRTYGYYERLSDDTGEWTPLQLFPSIINSKDADMKRIDLTGNGLSDLLSTNEEDEVIWHESLGKGGFSQQSRCRALNRDASPRILAADDTKATYLADMCGDGMDDIVQVSNGRVSYWPNLGYGRFGNMVVMGNAPTMDTNDLFDFERFHLLDVDGSGTTDILYLLSNGGAMVYYNQCGNAWSEGTCLSQFPRIDKLSNVFILDVLGNGTSCICWVGPDGSASDELVLQYLNLATGGKPHLLTSFNNNRGQKTKVSYQPSTKYSLSDERSGQPWKTRLPFPVHVVSKVIERDIFSLSSRITKYAYHDGFFDGQEQEFRGFGMIEIWERDEFRLTSDSVKPSRTPTKHVKMWYHTGSAKISLTPERGAFGQILVQSVIPEELGSFARQQAVRALKGREFRRETYGRDGTARSEVPYSVQDSTYDIELLLEPTNEENPGAFRVSSRESLSATYERDSDNPLMKHELVLARNKYGDITRSATVRYGCKKSNLEDARCRELQEAHDVVVTETKYTDPIDDINDSSEFYTPVVVSKKEFHLLNLSMDGIIDINAIKADGNADFGLTSSLSAKSTLKVIQGNESRRYYRNADLTRRLDLGEIDAGPILIDQSWDLSLSQAECQKAYGTSGEKLIGHSLAETMEEGGYQSLDGDGDWWAQAPRMRFITTSEENAKDTSERLRARTGFFVPTTTIDPFGNETIVEMDAYNLLPIKTTDAIGNVCRVSNDYRTMQADLVIDANGNRTGLKFNALGDRTAMSRMGKEGEAVGDTLDPDAPTAISLKTLTALMEHPSKEVANGLLGGWSKRWISSPRILDVCGRQLPPFQIELVRTKHVHQTDGEMISADILMNVTYFGNHETVVQTSTLESWNGGETQWSVSGCNVYDLDSHAVKSYHPFFSSDHLYKPHQDIETAGIFHFTDVIGRQVGTLYPDHTWSKTVSTAWTRTEVNAQHTISVVDARTDPDVGFYFASIPLNAFSPSWMELSRRGNEQAQLSATRSNGIADGGLIVSHLDPRGRQILLVESIKDKTRSNMFEYDFNGKVVQQVDTLKRVVQQTEYDRTGHRVAIKKMDAGTEATVYDCQGNLLLLCNSRGVSKHMEYDELRRLVQIWVQKGPGESEYLWSKTQYGEGDEEAEANNARGRCVSVTDQAGVRHTPRYDFKGNAVLKTTQLAVEYKTDIGLSLGVELEPTVYRTTSVHDALDRAILSTDALGKQTHRIFDHSGRLIRLKTKQTEANDWAIHVIDTKHSADGLPITIEYGNQSMTSYTYDPNTRNILRKKTLRDDGTLLEDISYTYDCLNRIVRTTDDAHGTVFFRNNRVSPAKEFWYDQWARLVKATGREMVSGNGTSSLSLRATNPGNPLAKMGLSPSNGKQLVAYTETYEYDDADNILLMQHQVSDEATTGWCRAYTYKEPSLIDPKRMGNRLSSTTLSGCTGKYGYNGTKEDDGMNGAGLVGCMTSMPGFNGLQWDCNGHLKSIARQAVKDGVPETTWFVYNSNGKRVRKITERARTETGQAIVKLKERLFLDQAEIYLKYSGDGISAVARTITSFVTALPNTDEPLVMLEKETSKQDASELMRYSLGPHLEVDDQALVVSYEEYSPFGTSTLVACRGGIEAPSSYRFASYRRDSETGFYHCGARYYLPHLGRWASADPLDTIDGPNTYSYCANDPVNWVDPDGTIRDWAIWRRLRGSLHPPNMTITQSVCRGALGVGATILAGVETRKLTQNMNPENAFAEAALDVLPGVVGLIAGPVVWAGLSLLPCFRPRTAAVRPVDGPVDGHVDGHVDGPVDGHVDGPVDGLVVETNEDNGDVFNDAQIYNADDSVLLNVELEEAMNDIQVTDLVGAQEVRERPPARALRTGV
ncbi:hypothetical protein G7Z17_g2360 [Cylindrodendrum hubeiense]|uniref:SpvB-domain-containing protein n=1 Tax=Cylindrodendrum hubeiense TaxID=595255 RepID=A0A9P5LL20_9HYPO|nr:hypothetical protein G7Z17_g2360 [Cylindrodendrum hubeiense]